MRDNLYGSFDKDIIYGSFDKPIMRDTLYGSFDKPTHCMEALISQSRGTALISQSLYGSFDKPIMRHPLWNFDNTDVWKL